MTFNKPETTENLHTAWAKAMRGFYSDVEKAKRKKEWEDQDKRLAKIKRRLSYGSVQYDDSDGDIAWLVAELEKRL